MPQYRRRRDKYQEEKATQDTHVIKAPSPGDKKRAVQFLDIFKGLSVQSIQQSQERQLRSELLK